MTGQLRVVDLDSPATHDLRRRVLRDHGTGAGVEFPEDARPGTVHLGVVDEGGALLAVATVLPEPTPHRPGAAAARLRGMAVEPGRQGSGVGTLLLDAVVARARAGGHTVIWANGRDGALGFYERHGWAIVGNGFESVGIPHHVVLLDL